ncbi:MAG: DUF1127 domain-containing protein [Rhodobacteraceae bacterium]|nr:DUF1127 domain-containing protein [Paracoccaceae bacterium]
MTYLPAPAAVRRNRSRMVRFTGWLHRRALARQTQNDLAHLNDHMLKDIGVTRHDATPLLPSLPR